MNINNLTCFVGRRVGRRVVAGGAAGVVVAVVVRVAARPSGGLSVLDEVVKDHDPLILLRPQRVEVVDIRVQLLLGLDGRHDGGGGGGGGGGRRVARVDGGAGAHRVSGLEGHVGGDGSSGCVGQRPVEPGRWTVLAAHGRQAYCGRVGALLARGLGALKAGDFDHRRWAVGPGGRSAHLTFRGSIVSGRAVPTVQRAKGLHGTL